MVRQRKIFIWAFRRVHIEILWFRSKCQLMWFGVDGFGLGDGEPSYQETSTARHIISQTMRMQDN